MASATDIESKRQKVAADVKRYHFPVEDIPRLSCLDPEVEHLIKNEVITAFYHPSCLCYRYCWETGSGVEFEKTESNHCSYDYGNYGVVYHVYVSVYVYYQYNTVIIIRSYRESQILAVTFTLEAACIADLVPAAYVTKSSFTLADPFFLLLFRFWWELGRKGERERARERERERERE